MGPYFDARETRSSDERIADLAQELPALIAHAQKNTDYFKNSLREIDASSITTEAGLAALPIVRKSDMVAGVKDTLPLRKFVGIPFHALHTIYQSPGPIYEAGMRGPDWWRFGRALTAVGVGQGDIVQNCFSYHFTPAGMMFESAAAAVGAVVVPAGTGQTEMQATAMANLGVTVYAGTPDYLKAILEKGDALGLDLSSVTRACVSAGPLFPALRQDYEDRGITCRQCYGTADVGHIAYESLALDGMIVDEGAIVEIVIPGTGIPVEDGQIGEVVVTTFSHETPLIRFATGDLSAILPGVSACGRTNKRIVGWRGRADQATKIKGMFVRPEQVAALVARHDEIIRARVTVTHNGATDLMTVQFEASQGSAETFAGSVQDIFKLRGEVEVVMPGQLPNDGLVIDDKRDID
ncbi:MAG: Phenylacetate-coenzyme A ligase [Alphaproteobacteria bacterium UBA4588]|nr:MAG: Phenylacetate-coenzyme A ligase [Alphaproteobacteria bacterium UBA4588]